MRTPQKVLVTGAGGFIGRAVTERFLQMGSHVIGVDLQANPALNIHSGHTPSTSSIFKRFWV